MPDLIDQLRDAAGTDRPPSDDARQLGLARLQQQIDSELRPDTVARRRRAPALITAATAAGAIALAAGAALIPTHGPGARTILERAAAAITPEQAEIITADIHGQQLQGQDTAAGADYGTVRVWVRQLPGHGTQEFRSLALDTAAAQPFGHHKGDETVSYPSARPAANGSLAFTTEVYTADDDRLSISRDTKAEMDPELFEARSLLAKARAGQDVELDEHADINGRPAYKLTWAETFHSPNPVVERMALWVDRDTYTPLQFTDHSRGNDAAGKAFDQTYKATITNFQRLPDTPNNRDALRMSDHPNADTINNR